MKAIGSMTLVVSPGTKVRLTIPVSSNSPVGSFRSTDTTKLWMGKNLTMVNGFIVDDENVGNITPLTGDDVGCVGVYYTQKTYGVNKVVYFGNMLEEFTFNIVNIPIHDHSSLSQGGPAHGTYFSEYDIQQTNGGA